MSIELVVPSNHLTLCRPLLLMPSVFPTIRVFSNESALHIQWPKYWSFSFSISPSNEHLGLISFRMDWFDQVVAPRLACLRLVSLLEREAKILSLGVWAWAILMGNFSSKLSWSLLTWSIGPFKLIDHLHLLPVSAQPTAGQVGG